MSELGAMHTDAIGKLFSLMYCNTSCSVQKDIGLLIGDFISKPLQPFCNHLTSLCLLSSAICAVIGFFPVCFPNALTGFFFIMSQHILDKRKSTFSSGSYFLQLNRELPPSLRTSVPFIFFTQIVSVFPFAMFFLA